MTAPPPSSSALRPVESRDSTLKTLRDLAALLGLLWLFLFSVNAMGTAIKAFGKGPASELMQSMENPLLGLMLGLLVTSLVQSSSTTTSLIVGLVGSGTLGVEGAVPMVMGANIGTTITNTLVSMGSIGRGAEFRRTFSAAVLHDVFNLLSVAVLLPLELMTGLISRPARFIAEVLYGAQVEKPHSFIYAHFKAAVQTFQGWLDVALSGTSANLALLAIAVVLLFASLGLIVRLMRGVILSRTEVFFDRLIGNSAVVAVVFGAVLTALVQSSSITTSLMVPLAGTGVITLRQMFPITLGCNIGTTITALLASFSTNRVDGLTVALCHLLFNLWGIVLIYLIPPMRNLTLRLAEHLGQLATGRKLLVLVYVLGVFFALPGAILGIQKLLGD